MKPSLPIRSLTGLLLVLLPALAGAETLTLAGAVEAARARQPELARARQTTAAAAARVESSRAPLLPQVNASAGYGLGTNNVGGSPAGNSWDLDNRFSAGLSVNQLVWDFGSTWQRYRAAGASLEAQRENEATQLDLVLLNVRAAFFGARANRALVKVAEENLASQERHREQIEAFVSVGTRPAIDLAQVRADVANARLQLVQAQNAYAQSKAELNRAMGVAQSTDYEVADEQLPPLAEEDAPEERLVAVALDARPELESLRRQSEALGLQAKAASGGYWPSVGVSTGVTNAGSDLGEMGPNWSLGATLSWNLFAGGATRAQVRELEATRGATDAALLSQQQQVRLEVVNARLGLGAAKASVLAADEAVAASRERLRLAEGRYQAGAGSILELQDAQVAVTRAEGQAIQAAFSVSLARAQLVRALGTEG